jgi:hypothetical protein
MPNYLRRPLKSSRSRSGSGGWGNRGSERRGADGAPQARREGASNERIGPMMDDRRVDPLAVTANRIGPMEDRRPSSRESSSHESHGDPIRYGYSAEDREKPRPVVRIIVKRRTPREG